MKNKTNPPLSEKDLDRLLGQSFLNLDSTKPENNAVIESIANYSLGRASYLLPYLRLVSPPPPFTTSNPYDLPKHQEFKTCCRL
jgi:hypothetical protein